MKTHEPHMAALSRMRSSLRAGLLAALATAVLGHGSVAVADSSHTRAQSPPIEMGTTGSNIFHFGEVEIDGATVTVCYTGTLGALVEDEGGTLYILSNNHILARGNEASVGEAIIHPGLGDQNPVCAQATTDTVANLSDFVPIKFGSGSGLLARARFRRNVVDAAIAEIVDENAVDASGAILDIGAVDPDPAAAVVGMTVQKSGRTTGRTTGTVAAVDVEIFVCYAAPCAASDIARFVNQLRLSGDLGAPGDSGSLIVECTDDLSGGCEANPQPVALLFAGGGGSIFANPIDAVLSELNVVMAGCTTDCFGGGGGGGGPPPCQGKNKNDPGCTEEAASTGLQRASEVKARHAEELLAIGGVVGTGIGLDDEGEPVIEVYLQSAARDAQHPIPSQLEGISIRVVITGSVTAY